MADYQQTQRGAAPGRAARFSTAVNFLGAALSLALVLGVAVWGYKLIVRDVSGVPVVRAAEGPLRVQPEDPGGRQALHQGLAVNGVAADGGAADPADRLVLAPEPLKLSLDDQALAQSAFSDGAGEEPAAGAATGGESLQVASVEALAEHVAAGIEPLTGIAPDAAPAAETEETEERPTSGLARSLRPHLRPATLRKKQAVAPAPPPSAVDPATIPAGTRLAQLGAFESEVIAQKEWTRLSGEFGEFLADKRRVVQKAKSGGRTFYRLRAMGFADLSDARRFCSALVAEDAECIPVVAR